MKKKTPIVLLALLLAGCGAVDAPRETAVTETSTEESESEADYTLLADEIVEQSRMVDILQDIGVETIEDVELLTHMQDERSHAIRFKVSVDDGKELEVSIMKFKHGKEWTDWKVANITKGSKTYYSSTAGTGYQTQNIYDYKTNEVVKESEIGDDEIVEEFNRRTESQIDDFNSQLDALADKYGAPRN